MGRRGAACVYAYHDEALVLERAMGQQSLMHMALDGQDDQASRIPLTLGFESLRLAARGYGDPYSLSLCTAEALLANPHDVVVLHGDMYHHNVLDFGARDWLAIDPKRVAGERGFDYASLICNPELPTATDPQRFRRQIGVVAEAASLERQRLLQWVLAFAGLSAAWFLEDGDTLAATGQLQVANLAACALGV